MDEHKESELRGLLGQREKLIYEAVKAGRAADLPHEDQLLARAIQEHMHLKHVHHALEFADVREGERYEITVDGETVNPMAHVISHAAVKGQLEEDPLVKAAFEKMVAAGASAHHAEHILAAMLFELHFETVQALEEGMDEEQPRVEYVNNLKRLVQDPVYRKNVTRQFTADHSVFE